MKIKSIKLTSEYEIKNSNPGIAYPGAKRTPVYQVEYEESTPSGLQATGTMLLESKNEEKIANFFNQLAKDLSKEFDEVSEKTVDNIYNISVTTGISVSEIAENVFKEMDKIMKELGR